MNNDLRTPSNNILFKIYKLLRRFHVAIWFYPFPFIVMVTMFNGAFRNSFKQEYTPEFFVPANNTEAEVSQVVEQTELNQNQEIQNNDNIDSNTNATIEPDTVTEPDANTNDDQLD